MCQKKVLALLVITAMLAALAAGCSPGAGDKAPEELPPPKEVNKSPVTGPRQADPKQQEEQPAAEPVNDTPVLTENEPGNSKEQTPGATPETSDPPAQKEIVYTYKVVKEFPHDPEAFTQGLYFRDGLFYEGTGLYGRSSLRKVNMEDGRVLRQVDLPAEYFGEGIVECGDRIIQLTWQENTGFVYDRETFQLLDTFIYDGEGWGLTFDGAHLVMSNGTEWLTYLDPVTFQPVKRLEVTDSQGPVSLLNELEYVEGKIYANVWHTDIIVIIDPATGKVTGKINLEELSYQAGRPKLNEDVLNGIAYDAENKRLFVTGKLWPSIYEIELVQANSP